MSHPTIKHWALLEQILSYLRGAAGLGIFLFPDANYGRCKDDNRSTLGYFMFVGGNLVSWRTKKHNVVFSSTVESEYKAMAGSIVPWIHRLLKEIDYAFLFRNQLSFCLRQD